VAGSFRIAEGYVEVSADESAYDRAMQRLKSKKTVVKVGVDLDDKDALAKLERLTRERIANVKIKLDESALSRLRLTDIEVTVSPKMSDAAFNRVKAQLDRLTKERMVTIRASADTRVAADELRNLVRRQQVRIGVDVDTRVAADSLANLTRRRNMTVGVNLNDTAARGRLDTLTRNRTVNVRADVDRSAASRISSMFSGGLSGAFSAIKGSLTSVVGLALQALPTLASLGQAIMQMGPAAAIAVPAVLSLGAAFAAIKLGTSGLGAAFKQAFAPAVSGGNAAAATAKKVEAAERSLAKAQQAVKDAEVNAAAARVKAARDIQDAQQNLKNTVSDVADANRRGAESVASAERDLADAQRAAKQAQLDLTQARKEAGQELEDLNARLSDAQLDQRQKVLDLQDATQELAKVKAKGAAATQEEIDKAQLQYDKALQALTEQQTETQRLQDQTDAANAAGVEGSDKVAKAKQGIADANQTVKDKTQSLTDAEIEAARAQVDGAQRIAKAQRDVADAQAAAAKAATDGARQIKDAQEAAKEAAQALAEAQTAGATATSKVADAMSKLAPNARAFVDAVIAQRAAWRGLKLDVQNALFAGLGQKFTTMSTAILPSLKTGLSGTATVLNRMAKNAADAVTHLGKTGQLRQMFAGLNHDLKPLSRFPAQFITGLTQVSIAAAPAFGRLTTAAGSMADTIARKLNTAFASGRLEDSINQAVNVAKQFGHLLGDILGTLGNIMKAASAAGGDALGGIGAAFKELRKITAMPEVQKALTSIFTALNAVAKLLAGTLGAVIQAALPLLAALAPVVTQLAEQFGPVLAQLAQALGKALMPIITALLPVVKDIGGVLVGLVRAVMPLLQPIGDLIAAVIQAVAPFIKTLLDALVPFIAALAKGLAPVITALLPALQLVGQFLGVLAPMFPALLTALMPLIPPISQLAVALLNLALQVITPLMPLITGLAQMLAGVLAIAIALLVPVITTVIGWITSFVNAMTTGVKVIVDAFKWLFDVLVGHSIIPDLVNAIVGWFAHLWSETKKIFNELKNWLVNLWNSIWTSLRTKWNSFWSGFNSSITGAWRTVRDGFNGLKTGVTNTWNSLWNSARDKVASIFTTVNGKINSFVSGMKSAFSNLKNALGTIWDGVKSKIGTPIKFVVGSIYNQGIRKMWNTIAGAISSKLTLPAISLGFNTGGIVPGAGNHDTVPAMLTPGERILSNQQVAKMGGHRAIDAALGDGPTQPQRKDRRRPVPEFGGGGIIGTVTGALGSAADWAKDAVLGSLQAAARKAISAVIRPLINRIPGGGGIGGLMKGMSNRALDGILSYFGRQDKKAQNVDYKPGAGVAQWAPQIRQALQLLGQSSGWLGTVERRMNQESGGNPTAVNRNDINWQNGTPSVGLMQVIGPTFKANAGQFRNSGPFMYGTSTAALPNIYAGLNYALHRYGSLTALNRPGGYDQGGLLQPGATLAVNKTGRPERVLSADHTAQLDAMLAAGSGGGVTIENITVSGTFDFSSPASRRAAANALVAEMKEAIRLYDKARAR
jgi:phage-related protein/SLT domain-containing protein